MTKDSVQAVVQMLRARGEVPSQRKVLTLLGRGSKRDVSRYLRELAGTGSGELGDEPGVAPDDEPGIEPDEPGTIQEPTVPAREAPEGEPKEPDPVQVAQARLGWAEHDLAQAQATLATAQAELVGASETEARARDQYHTSEAQRLRAGDGDGAPGSARDELRHVWVEARLMTEALTDVITVLRQDVSAAQDAVQDAQVRAKQHAARQAWNSMVAGQHAAMQRLHHGFEEAKAAVAEIERLAHAQAPHGAVLGLDVSVSLFRRRSLRFWLEYRVSELTGHRPDAAIYHWMQDESLENLNPFAQGI
jgi:hypothetical protein